MSLSLRSFLFFFFNDTAPTEIYTLSLHDALPICQMIYHEDFDYHYSRLGDRYPTNQPTLNARSEEHTSELQSLTNLVCRLLLEKKNKISTSKIRATTIHHPEEAIQPAYSPTMINQ